MGSSPEGICPACDSRRGTVGTTCPGEGCVVRAYRFVPIEWHEAQKESERRSNLPPDALVGRSIGRYLLVGKLGQGGMGAVYAALQSPLNRVVALKLVSGVELTHAAVSRFEREARAISELDHPNVVKLYDYGVGALEPEGPSALRLPFMALEYVRHGRTLRRVFAQMREESGGRIPGATVLAIFEQVLNALGTAHDAGLVHRDMKPDNVMVASVRGNPLLVKVLDFGLAKAFSEVTGFDGDVTRPGNVMGTPFYMAPEQAPRKILVPIDGRADLYSVAVMLFEVFTGTRPFPGDNALVILAKKEDPEHRPLESPEARALPSRLRAFLARGMEANPAARFPDAAGMLDALREALSDGDTTATGLVLDGAGSSERPPTPASPPVAAGTTKTLPRRSVPLWAAVVLVGLVLGAVGATVVIVSGGGGRVPTSEPNTPSLPGALPVAAVQVPDPDAMQGSADATRVPEAAEASQEHDGHRGMPARSSPKARPRRIRPEEWEP
jgi:serine/threonine-protein kinase